MSENTNTETSKQPTALERLERLERQGNVSQALKYQVSNMTQTLETVRATIIELSRGLEAVTDVLFDKGVISKDECSNRLVDNATQRQLDSENNLVSSGLAADVDSIGDTSYVVCEQKSKDGSVDIPRFGTRVSDLQAEVKELFLSKKVGDVLEVSEKTLTVLRILNAVESGSRGDTESLEK
jgi:hypothetical protein